MPSIGDVSRRDKEGLQGRGRIVWAACPVCNTERWVPAKAPQQLCRVCSGKIAIQRDEFRNASHADDCQCQRCKASQGLLVRSDSPTWKGGRRKHKSGYVYVMVDEDDPMRCMAGRDPYVFEHRLVLARHLGRPLTPIETVHHRNGDRLDNRLENLELWAINHSNGQRVEEYHCPGCRCFEKEQ